MVAFPDIVKTTQTVLISGPPQTGKYRLFHALLDERGDHPVVIATAKTADDVRADHQRTVGSDGEFFVVDCLSAGRGDHPRDTELTKYVDSPGNLTRIGVKVTEILESLPPADTAPVVGVHSVSQLLLHAGLEQTYQFVHILAQQTAAEEIPLVAVLNDRAHDEQTVNAIFERFEGRIETRTTNGEHEFRTRAPLADPTEWKRI